MKRIKMGGHPEEVYWSMLVAALTSREIDGEFPFGKFLLASNYRPTRKEPLCEIASFCNQHKFYPLAYMIAKTGYDIPKTEDSLFVIMSVENWRMADELAVAAFGTGRYQECKDVCEELLIGDKLPKNQVRRVKGNLRSAIEELNARNN